MIEQIADPALLTIGALHNALSAQPATVDATVLSLSVDQQNSRSRVELGLDTGASVDPAMLALMAAQILRSSFGGALGVLRVDVYRCAPGGGEAGALVATHGDFAVDRARQSA